MSSQALPAQAKQLFQHLFEKASLGIAVEDLEGRLLLANPALSSMLGYQENELCGMNCSQFANAEDSEDDWALFEQLRAGVIDHYSLEKRYVRKDGAQLWGRLNVSLMKDDDGGTPLVLAFVEEITEDKLAKQEVARIGDRLRLAAEGGKSVGWEWDLKTGQDSWFGDLRTMFGINSDTFVGRPEDFYQYVHPEDRELVAKAVADARQGQKPYAAEFRVVRLDGTVRWVSAKGTFYYGTNGDAVRMLGMATDITERKLLEQKLREYEKAVEGSEEMIAVVDREYRYVIANRKFLKLRNMTKEQVIGRLVADILNKGVFDTVIKEKLDECFQGKVVRYEMKYTYPEIGERDVFISNFPIEGANGVDRVACILQDITERKQTEEELRQKDEDLTEAQRLAGVGSWRWDARTDTVTWSAELYHLVGRDPSLPTPSFEEQSTLFAAESWDRLQIAVKEALQTGTSYELDMEILTPELITKWAIARGEPLRDADGEIIGLRGTVQDITERKRAEAALASVSRKLIEAQEQERTRIGRELHDDIGQRLALLAVELQQLHEDPRNFSEARSLVGELHKQTLEIAAEIQSLSHELHSAKLQYLGIAAATRGFCQEFGEQQKVKIDFETHDLPSSVPPDISLCFFRVLQEALHNSAKHSGVKHFEVRLWGASYEMHLTIEDSGIGFDRETAKASRGLGLVSMEERVKLVNGTLSIESNLQRGTTIHARVPLKETDSMRAAG